MRLIHRRARVLIEDRGLRYDRVAQKIGLTKDRFAHILDGRRPVPEPADIFYASLANVIGCDPTDLHEAVA